VWGGLGAAVGMLALAACSASPSVTKVIARAPTRTTDQKTARIFETVTITPTSGPVQHLTSTGVGDFGAHRFDLSTTIAGQTVEIVLSGTTLYEKVPPLTSATGKPWVSFDLDTIGKLVGVKGLGDLVQSQSNDPTAGLQFLSGVTGPVTVVGHEVVRGVTTTHFRVTTSLDLAIARLPAAEQAGVRHFIDDFGVHAAVADVWIDGPGRVRRYHYAVAYHPTTLPAGIPASALPKSVDYTTELYDFGTPAAIPVPPAAQTADLSQTLGRLGAAMGSGPAGPANVPSSVGSGAPSGSAAAQSLAGLLLTSLPPGYQQAPDSVGQTGPSDLAKAVSDDGGSDAEQVLSFDQFIAGYQRMWTSGNNQIIEFLYEFGTPRGAIAYGQRQVAADAVPPSGDQIAPLAVPAIAGAQGFTISGNDGPADVVLFTKAGFLVQIVMNGTDATAQQVTALATAQYQRLSPG
jgi:hypothetical protein